MYQRILVPIDGSNTSNRGLTEAIALAKLTGGRIRVVHVVDELSFAVNSSAFAGYTSDVITLLRESGEKILATAKETVEAAGVGVDCVLHESFAGRLSELVIDEATKWSAELIVIGTHGRRGAERMLMGSDAEQILRLAPVPVLLVRAPGK